MLILRWNVRPFRFHVFVCNQQKPEGLPCCSDRGGVQILEALRQEVHLRGLDDEVQLTACGSLGLCEHGPNIVVHPEGTWYSGVTAADIPEIVQSHFLEGIPVKRLERTDQTALLEEIQTNREKFLAARRAAEASGALPDDLNDRLRAFQESRVILTALELDLFTVLGAGATAAEVAAKLPADPRATEMLLNALASMQLLSKQDGVFQNSPAAARFFAAPSRDNARPALLHTANLWHRWSTLTECVRRGTAVAESEIADRGPDWTESFIAAMHRNALARAPLVIRAVGAQNVRRMLDVGGGSGAYSIAFAQSNPGLQADILDLATVEPIARRHVRDAGVEDRVKIRPGDLCSGQLGQDYDLVLVSAICHMLSPEVNRDLLRRCHQALAPHGRLVIQDFILDACKTAPRSAALFSLNMLVGTRDGSSYSGPEYSAWLEEAGFQEIRHVRLPGPADLIIATRP